ncbi:leucine rich repeat-containing protein, partial [Cystoisospora suis]
MWGRIFFSSGTTPSEEKREERAAAPSLSPLNHPPTGPISDSLSGSNVPLSVSSSPTSSPSFVTPSSPPQPLPSPASSRVLTYHDILQAQGRSADPSTSSKTVPVPSSNRVRRVPSLLGPHQQRQASPSSPSSRPLSSRGDSFLGPTPLSSPTSGHVDATPRENSSSSSASLLSPRCHDEDVYGSKQRPADSSSSSTLPPLKPSHDSSISLTPAGSSSSLPSLPLRYLQHRFVYTCPEWESLSGSSLFSSPTSSAGDTPRTPGEPLSCLPDPDGGHRGTPYAFQTNSFRSFRQKNSQDTNVQASLHISSPSSSPNSHLLLHLPLRRPGACVLIDQTIEDVHPQPSAARLLNSSLEEEHSLGKEVSLSPLPSSTVLITIRKSSLRKGRISSDEDEREDDADSVPRESDDGDDGDEEKKLPAASVSSLFSSPEPHSTDNTATNPLGGEDFNTVLNVQTCQLARHDSTGLGHTEEDGGGGGSLFERRRQSSLCSSTSSSSLSPSSSSSKARDLSQGCALHVSRCKVVDGKIIKEKKRSASKQKTRHGGYETFPPSLSCCLSPDIISGVPKTFSPYIRELRASSCGISIISPDFYFLVHRRRREKDTREDESHKDRPCDGSQDGSVRRRRDRDGIKGLEREDEAGPSTHERSNREISPLHEGEEEISDQKRGSRRGSDLLAHGGRLQGEATRRKEEEEKDRHVYQESHGRERMMTIPSGKHERTGGDERREGGVLETHSLILRKEIRPGFFSYLPVLEFLDLRWNNLSSLPLSIAHLTSLHTLLLDGNALTSLPVVLLFLPHLKILSVSSNFLTAFPSLFSCNKIDGEKARERGISDSSPLHHSCPSPFLPGAGPGGEKKEGLSQGGGGEQGEGEREENKRSVGLNAMSAHRGALDGGPSGGPSMNRGRRCIRLNSVDVGGMKSNKSDLLLQEREKRNRRGFSPDVDDDEETRREKKVIMDCLRSLSETSLTSSSSSSCSPLEILHLEANALGDVSFLSSPFFSHLREVHIHCNNFTLIPLRLYQQGHPQNPLTELSLDWLRYTSPPLPRLIRGSQLRRFLSRLQAIETWLHAHARDLKKKIEDVLLHDVSRGEDARSSLKKGDLSSSSSYSIHQSRNTNLPSAGIVSDITSRGRYEEGERQGGEKDEEQRGRTCGCEMNHHLPFSFFSYEEELLLTGGGGGCHSSLSSLCSSSSSFVDSSASIPPASPPPLAPQSVAALAPWVGECSSSRQDHLSGLNEETSHHVHHPVSPSFSSDFSSSSSSLSKACSCCISFLEFVYFFSTDEDAWVCPPVSSESYPRLLSVAPSSSSSSTCEHDKIFFSLCIQEIRLAVCRCICSDISLASDSRGRTRLHVAALEGHEGVARALTRGGKSSLYFLDADGWSPFFLSIKEKQFNLAVFLTEEVTFSLRQRRQEIEEDLKRRKKKKKQQMIPLLLREDEEIDEAAGHEEKIRRDKKRELMKHFLSIDDEEPTHQGRGGNRDDLTDQNKGSEEEREKPLLKSLRKEQITSASHVRDAMLTGRKTGGKEKEEALPERQATTIEEIQQDSLHEEKKKGAKNRKKTCCSSFSFHQGEDPYDDAKDEGCVMFLNKNGGGLQKGYLDTSLIHSSVILPPRCSSSSSSFFSMESFCPSSSFSFLPSQLALLDTYRLLNGGAGIYGTPLHVATVNFDFPLCSFLLHAGCDITAVDADGNSPLHVLFSVFDRGGGGGPGDLSDTLNSSSSSSSPRRSSSFLSKPYPRNTKLRPACSSRSLLLGDHHYSHTPLIYTRDSSLLLHCAKKMNECEAKTGQLTPLCGCRSKDYFSFFSFSSIGYASHAFPTSPFYGQDKHVFLSLSRNAGSNGGRGGETAVGYSYGHSFSSKKRRQFLRSLSRYSRLRLHFQRLLGTSILPAAIEVGLLLIHHPRIDAISHPSRVAISLPASASSSALSPDGEMNSKCSPQEQEEASQPSHLNNPPPSTLGQEGLDTQGHLCPSRFYPSTTPPRPLSPNDKKVASLSDQGKAIAPPTSSSQRASDAFSMHHPPPHSSYSLVSPPVIRMCLRVNQLNNDLWGPIHLAARRGQQQGLWFVRELLEVTHPKCKKGTCVHAESVDFIAAPSVFTRAALCLREHIRGSKTKKTTSEFEGMPSLMEKFLGMTPTQSDGEVYSSSTRNQGGWMRKKGGGEDERRGGEQEEGDRRERGESRRGCRGRDRNLLPLGEKKGGEQQERNESEDGRIERRRRGQSEDSRGGSPQMISHYPREGENSVRRRHEIDYHVVGLNSLLPSGGKENRVVKSETSSTAINQEGGDSSSTTARKERKEEEKRFRGIAESPSPGVSRKRSVSADAISSSPLSASTSPPPAGVSTPCDKEKDRMIADSKKDPASSSSGVRKENSGGERQGNEANPFLSASSRQQKKLPGEKTKGLKGSLAEEIPQKILKDISGDSSCDQCGVAHQTTSSSGVRTAASGMKDVERGGGRRDGNERSSSCGLGSTEASVLHDKALISIVRGHRSCNERGGGEQETDGPLYEIEGEGSIVGPKLRNEVLHFQRHSAASSAAEALQMAVFAIFLGPHAAALDFFPLSPTLLPPGFLCLLGGGEGREGGHNASCAVDVLQHSLHTRVCPFTFDLNLRGGSHLWTPLHLAAHSGSFKLVQQLLDGGAHAGIVNRLGKNSRAVARGSHQQAIERFIQQQEQLDAWRITHRTAKCTYSSASGNTSPLALQLRDAFIRLRVNRFGRRPRFSLHHHRHKRKGETGEKKKNHGCDEESSRFRNLAFSDGHCLSSSLGGERKKEGGGEEGESKEVSDMNERYYETSSNRKIESRNKSQQESFRNFLSSSGGGKARRSSFVSSPLSPSSFPPSASSSSSASSNSRIDPLPSTSSTLSSDELRPSPNIGSSSSSSVSTIPRPAHDGLLSSILQGRDTVQEKEEEKKKKNRKTSLALSPTISTYDNDSPIRGELMNEGELFNDYTSLTTSSDPSSSAPSTEKLRKQKGSSQTQEEEEEGLERIEKMKEGRNASGWHEEEKKKVEEEEDTVTRTSASDKTSVFWQRLYSMPLHLVSSIVEDVTRSLSLEGDEDLQLPPGDARQGEERDQEKTREAEENNTKENKVERGENKRDGKAESSQLGDQEDQDAVSGNGRRKDEEDVRRSLPGRERKEETKDRYERKEKEEQEDKNIFSKVKQRRHSEGKRDFEISPPGEEEEDSGTTTDEEEEGEEEEEDQQGHGSSFHTAHPQESLSCPLFGSERQKLGAFTGSSIDLGLHAAFNTARFLSSSPFSSSSSSPPLLPPCPSIYSSLLPEHREADPNHTPASSPDSLALLSSSSSPRSSSCVFPFLSSPSPLSTLAIDALQASALEGPPCRLISLLSHEGVTASLAAFHPLRILSHTSWLLHDRSSPSSSSFHSSHALSYFFSPANRSFLGWSDDRIRREGREEESEKEKEDMKTMRDDRAADTDEGDVWINSAVTCREETTKKNRRDVCTPVQGVRFSSSSRKIRSLSEDSCEGGERGSRRRERRTCSGSHRRSCSSSSTPAKRRERERLPCCRHTSRQASLCREEKWRDGKKRDRLSLLLLLLLPSLGGPQHESDGRYSFSHRVELMRDMFEREGEEDLLDFPDISFPYRREDSLLCRLNGEDLEDLEMMFYASILPPPYTCPQETHEKKDVKEENFVSLLNTSSSASSSSFSSFSSASSSDGEFLTSSPSSLSSSSFLLSSDRHRRHSTSSSSVQEEEEQEGRESDSQAEEENSALGLHSRKPSEGAFLIRFSSRESQVFRRDDPAAVETRGVSLEPCHSVDDQEDRTRAGRNAGLEGGGDGVVDKREEEVSREKREQGEKKKGEERENNAKVQGHDDRKKDEIEGRRKTEAQEEEDRANETREEKKMKRKGRRKPPHSLTRKGFLRRADQGIFSGKKSSSSSSRQQKEGECGDTPPSSSWFFSREEQEEKKAELGLLLGDVSMLEKNIGDGDGRQGGSLPWKVFLERYQRLLGKESRSSQTTRRRKRSRGRRDLEKDRGTWPLLMWTVAHGNEEASMLILDRLDACSWTPLQIETKRGEEDSLVRDRSLIDQFIDIIGDLALIGERRRALLARTPVFHDSLLLLLVRGLPRQDRLRGLACPLPSIGRQNLLHLFMQLNVNGKNSSFSPSSFPFPKREYPSREDREEAGTDPDSIPFDVGRLLLTQKNSEGVFPFLAACFEKDFSLLSQMLSYCCRCRCEDTRERRTSAKGGEGEEQETMDREGEKKQLTFSEMRSLLLCVMMAIETGSYPMLLYFLYQPYISGCPCYIEAFHPAGLCLHRSSKKRLLLPSPLPSLSEEESTRRESNSPFSFSSSASFLEEWIEPRNSHEDDQEKKRKNSGGEDAVKEKEKKRKGEGSENNEEEEGREGMERKKREGGEHDHGGERRRSEEEEEKEEEGLLRVEQEKKASILILLRLQTLVVAIQRRDFRAISLLFNSGFLSPSLLFTAGVLLEEDRYERYHTRALQKKVAIQITKRRLLRQRQQNPHRPLQEEQEEERKEEEEMRNKEEARKKKISEGEKALGREGEKEEDKKKKETGEREMKNSGPSAVSDAPGVYRRRYCVNLRRILTLQAMLMNLRDLLLRRKGRKNEEEREEEGEGEEGDEDSRGEEDEMKHIQRRGEEEEEGGRTRDGEKNTKREKRNTDESRKAGWLHSLSSKGGMNSREEKNISSSMVCDGERPHEEADQEKAQDRLLSSPVHEYERKRKKTKKKTRDRHHLLVSWPDMKKRVHEILMTVILKGRRKTLSSSRKNSDGTPAEEDDDVLVSLLRAHLLSALDTLEVTRASLHFSNNSSSPLMGIDEKKEAPTSAEVNRESPVLQLSTVKEDDRQGEEEEEREKRQSLNLPSPLRASSISETNEDLHSSSQEPTRTAYSSEEPTSSHPDADINNDSSSTHVTRQHQHPSLHSRNSSSSSLALMGPCSPPPFFPLVALSRMVATSMAFEGGVVQGIEDLPPPLVSFFNTCWSCGKKSDVLTASSSLSSRRSSLPLPLSLFLFSSSSSSSPSSGLPIYPSSFSHPRQFAAGTSFSQTDGACPPSSFALGSEGGPSIEGVSSPPVHPKRRYVVYSSGGDADLFFNALGKRHRRTLLKQQGRTTVPESIQKHLGCTYTVEVEGCDVSSRTWGVLCPSGDSLAVIPRGGSSLERNVNDSQGEEKATASGIPFSFGGLKGENFSFTGGLRIATTPGVGGGVLREGTASSQFFGGRANSGKGLETGESGAFCDCCGFFFCPSCLVNLHEDFLRLLLLQEIAVYHRPQPLFFLLSSSRSDESSLSVSPFSSPQSGGRCMTAMESTLAQKLKGAEAGQEDLEILLGCLEERRRRRTGSHTNEQKGGAPLVAKCVGDCDVDVHEPTPPDGSTGEGRPCTSEHSQYSSSKYNSGCTYTRDSDEVHGGARRRQSHSTSDVVSSSPSIVDLTVVFPSSSTKTAFPPTPLAGDLSPSSSLQAPHPREKIGFLTESTHQTPVMEGDKEEMEVIHDKRQVPSSPNISQNDKKDNGNEEEEHKIRESQEKSGVASQVISLSLPLPSQAKQASDQESMVFSPASAAGVVGGQENSLNASSSTSSSGSSPVPNLNEGEEHRQDHVHHEDDRHDKSHGRQSPSLLGGERTSGRFRRKASKGRTSSHHESEQPSPSRPPPPLLQMITKEDGSHAARASGESSSSSPFKPSSRLWRLGTPTGSQSSSSSNSSSSGGGGSSRRTKLSSVFSSFSDHLNTNSSRHPPPHHTPSSHAPPLPPTSHHSPSSSLVSPSSCSSSSSPLKKVFLPYHHRSDEDEALALPSSSSGGKNFSPTATPTDRTHLSVSDNTPMQGQHMQGRSEESPHESSHSSSRRLSGLRRRIFTGFLKKSGSGGGTSHRSSDTTVTGPIKREEKTPTRMMEERRDLREEDGDDKKSMDGGSSRNRQEEEDRRKKPEGGVDGAKQDDCGELGEGGERRRGKTGGGGGEEEEDWRDEEEEGEYAGRTGGPRSDQNVPSASCSSRSMSSPRLCNDSSHQNEEKKRERSPFLHVQEEPVLSHLSQPSSLSPSDTIARPRGCSSPIHTSRHPHHPDMSCVNDSPSIILSSSSKASSLLSLPLSKEMSSASLRKKKSILDQLRQQKKRQQAKEAAEKRQVALQPFLGSRRSSSSSLLRTRRRKTQQAASSYLSRYQHRLPASTAPTIPIDFNLFSAHADEQTLSPRLLESIKQAPPLGDQESEVKKTTVKMLSQPSSPIMSNRAFSSTIKMTKTPKVPQRQEGGGGLIVRGDGDGFYMQRRLSPPSNK